MLPPLLSLPLALLAACPGPQDPVARTPQTLVAGAPVAGMAEGVMDLPVGAPLGGFSSRCSYLGGSSKVDNRKTPYTVGFVPSVGVHTPARAQVLWLENGDQQLLLARMDAIYSSDALVDALEARLGAATGIDMEGKVVLATSHSHHAVADFTPQEGFFLGGDRYDEEIFQRMVGSIEALALQAYEARVPAAIGIGMAQDWDPDDRVYRDRRGENDATVFFEDLGAGSYKDPNLWLLRVDTAEGEPMGFFFTFGMHGTTLSEESPLQSTDSAGAVEAVLRERFDQQVVVAHMQGGGGDASPAGTDEDMARLETIGEYAADAIYSLWEQTPTSAAPFTMESFSRGISMEREQISVEREWGDLVYTPYDDSEGYAPDNVVYDDQGRIITPIDEFNAPYGGVFCGYDDPLLSSGTIGSSVFPYDGCMDVELISGLIFGIFGMNVEELELPLDHMMRAQVTAARLGPLPLRLPDGSEVMDDALLAFFPGETSAVYAEQFRRRVRAEQGFEHALPVGYAQDHEGYLLVPEDWLLGGYEPNITFWGPLGAEHVMEGLMQGAGEELTTDLVEPADLLAQYPTTTYPAWPLGAVAPDLTPAAGTLADAIPKTLWTPLMAHGLAPELAPPTQVRRVQDVVQITWNGGDPMVDSPRVVLEKEEGGSFVPVTTRSGRQVSSDDTDMLTAWLPDPLYPVDVAQTHTWWTAWQAVSWGGDRAGLPLGTYRLRIDGSSYAGGASTWPWPETAYQVLSEPFELLPADISVEAVDGGLRAAIVAPSWGWRLVDLQGSSRGANPLVDAQLWLEFADGELELQDEVATVDGGWSRFSTELLQSPPADVVAVVIVDAYGNQGRLPLPALR